MESLCRKWLYDYTFQVAMRALGFEPKKEEIRKMISDIDKDGSGENHCKNSLSVTKHVYTSQELLISMNSSK